MQMLLFSEKFSANMWLGLLEMVLCELTSKEAKRFKMKFIHKMKLIRTKLDAVRQKIGSHNKRQLITHATGTMSHSVELDKRELAYVHCPKCQPVRLICKEIYSVPFRFHLCI